MNVLRETLVRDGFEDIAPEMAFDLAAAQTAHRRIELSQKYEGLHIAVIALEGADLAMFECPFERNPLSKRYEMSRRMNSIRRAQNKLRRLDNRKANMSRDKARSEVNAYRGKPMVSTREFQANLTGLPRDYTGESGNLAVFIEPGETGVGGRLESYTTYTAQMFDSSGAPLVEAFNLGEDPNAPYLLYGNGLFGFSKK